MKRILITNLILCFVYSFSCAQNLYPTVLNVGGTEVVDQSVYLQWSVGELAIGTYFLDTNSFTEGFCQPYIITISAVPEIVSNIYVNTFPNPTLNDARIQIEGVNLSSTAKVVVFDQMGKLISVRNEITELSNGNSVFLSLSSLNNGVYYINILDKTLEIPIQAKIIKNK